MEFYRSRRPPLSANYGERVTRASRMRYVLIWRIMNNRVCRRDLSVSGAGNYKAPEARHAEGGPRLERPGLKTP